MEYRSDTLQNPQNSATRVMGILNITPDSFYDGGLYHAENAALQHLQELVDQGADIIDIGGESSRPGADPVPADEEKKRIASVLPAAVASGIPVSIDTIHAATARFALEAGACIINDISSFRHDPAMAALAAEHECLCILMHMQGTPKTMQAAPCYKDIISDIIDFFKERIDFALKEGVAEENIWLDPGFGFGKTVAHNLELLRRFEEFQVLGFPLVLGTSNKSTIGTVLNLPPDERLEGTAATVAIGIMKGVHCIRVHDVRAMSRVAKMCDAVLGRDAGQTP
ncbi:MAG TPA: dihydropteroate synthase [Candidatus Hydrogenedentes bacterium]|jgi:dihydropteroate synthase|nr:MAG: Dihydropteroate synthase [Candidatus Hydrogenedentes bacterium ADurb.Bin170]HOD95524.1 dihydropteroate synthase [Candidatus Hydrogenedentota bacterium]HOM47847.1 dihydropteroate synthase [Candidatus Hydrogenedentota bacterium]HOR51139.1 dihydropteroate synthase [Candidatus Hydrogenedentota bacterium]HPK24905.1 dihydropteroate synthase [Candidatus Hydrogenedentota bacterium]